MSQNNHPDLTQAIHNAELPKKVHTETLVQAVESAKSEADAAAQKAAIVEAESAFVPDAGEWEVRIRKCEAKQDADKAAVVEQVAITVIETEIKEKETGIKT